MSDLHGGNEQLGQIIEHIEREYPGEKQFIFLGDYIDRGPQTRELLNRLITLDNGHNIFLRGNHDDMALGLSPNYVQSGFRNGFANWMSNGGEQTLKSYGVDWSKHHFSEEALYNLFSQEHREWLLKHPYFYKDEQRTYVHAGFYRADAEGNPWPIETQNYQVLTWIRDPFLKDNSNAGGYVVHGHTPTIFYYSREPAMVDICDNRCNVDTGAVYGGVLSAAIFDESRPGPIATIDHTGKHIKVS